MKPPKDPRLNDAWRWQLAGAFLLLSPGVNSQRSPGSARTMTDAVCVENLAGLSAVKELKPSSRASGRGQCSVLETSTAAESVVHRKGTRIALYLKPDRFDLQFATEGAHSRRADTEHVVDAEGSGGLLGISSVEQT